MAHHQWLPSASDQEDHLPSWMEPYAPVKSIHEWFELTYAQYLTIPRSVLQSMPTEWQERFVQCLEELDDTIDWRPQGQYWVELRDSRGKYMRDPLRNYQRGRRRIAHNDDSHSNPRR